MDLLGNVYLIVVLCGILIVPITGQCDDATRPLDISATPLPYYISSQNYPDDYETNSDCAWIVTAPSPDDRIIINIEDIFIEGVISCSNDYLSVFDGADNSANELAKICLATHDDVNALVSSTDSLYITFTSDNSLQYRGFNILLFSNSTDYQPACDGSSNLTATSQSQYIMSPNLPYEYESNFSCVIRIYPQTLYYGITFNMTFLDVEVSKGCVNDALRFVSVGEESSVDTEVMCTRAVDFEHDNFPLDVTGTYIEIHFTTNPADNFYGFMLSFTELFKGINLTSLDNGDTIEITVPEDLATGGHVNDTVCVIALTYTGTINLKITPLYEASTNDNITDQDIQLFALVEEQPYVYLDLISSLDYEIISKFTLLAKLIDSDVPQVTYTVTFNVTVTDVDDVAPEFLNLPGNYTLSRGQKKDEVIFTVNATDNDVSEEFRNILFSINSGDVDSMFAIKKKTGEVKLTQDAKNIPLTTSQYDLVIGTNRDSLSTLMSTGDLTIYVNPDSPPECSQTSVWGETLDVNTATASTKVTLIDTWSCTDDNVNLTYSVEAASPNVSTALFNIDEVGEVTLLREFNISEVISRQFLLTIGVTDSVGQTVTFSMYMNVTSLSCLPNPRNLYVRMDKGDGDVILNGFNCTNKYGLDYILTQYPAGTFEVNSASNGTVYLILRAPVIKIKFYSLSITITDGVDIAVLRFKVIVQTKRCGVNSATTAFDGRHLFMIVVSFYWNYFLLEF